MTFASARALAAGLHGRIVPDRAMGQQEEDQPEMVAAKSAHASGSKALRRRSRCEAETERIDGSVPAHPEGVHPDPGVGRKLLQRLPPRPPVGIGKLSARPGRRPASTSATISRSARAGFAIGASFGF
jgi:hypothetical protein